MIDLDKIAQIVTSSFGPIPYIVKAHVKQSPQWPGQRDLVVTVIDPVNNLAYRQVEELIDYKTCSAAEYADLFRNLIKGLLVQALDMGFRDEHPGSKKI